MRIAELAPSQGKFLARNPWGFPRELVQWLKTNGFEDLSQGYYEGKYSSVFASPNSGAVVKISKQQDQGWLAFAQYASREWRQNKHLPKITRIITYPFARANGTEQLFIAFMERLAVIPEHRYNEDDFFIGLRTFLVARLGTYDEGVYRHFQGAPEHVAQLADKWASDNELLANTLHTIKAMIPSGCSLDLHGTNLMMRGNTVVISDPYAAD